MDSTFTKRYFENYSNLWVKEEVKHKQATFTVVDKSYSDSLYSDLSKYDSIVYYSYCDSLFPSFNSYELEVRWGGKSILNSFQKRNSACKSRCVTDASILSYRVVGEYVKKEHIIINFSCGFVHDMEELEKHLKKILAAITPPQSSRDTMSFKSFIQQYFDRDLNVLEFMYEQDESKESYFAEVWASYHYELKPFEHNKSKQKTSKELINEAKEHLKHIDTLQKEIENKLKEKDIKIYTDKNNG